MSEIPDITLFLVWKKLAQDLKELKIKEAKARRFLCGSILDGGRKADLTIGGYRIKAKEDISYKLDESMLSAIMADLTEEDKLAVRFKPALNLRAYKKLDENSLLHDAVTAKPAMPTLEVKEID